ncbi:MAG: hypothetical protein KIT84_25225 [Labilithrix sp.]|nr:hypothetical protein [Labilithrix sp.]MCW5814354.1 hypothetical protein [Labilithrix sp.]
MSTPMKTNDAFTLSVALVTTFFVACADESGELSRRPNDGDAPGAADTAATQEEQDPNDPALCKAKSRDYQSFDHSSLTEKRVVTRLGNDRGRVKPFSALQTEYARVLGAAPARLAGSGATFGQVPKNWYEEPHASAIALQTAYDIAFDGCLDYTKTDAAFAGAPDATSAPAQCGAMIRKFWSRVAAPQEVQACVDMATTGAAAEPDPRRKWAYACASVLSSAGFMTY